jgi:simple sugar transport system permease protein
MAVSSTSGRLREIQAARSSRPFLVKASDWVRDRPEGGIAVLFGLALLCCVVGGLLFPDKFRFLAQANIEVTLKSVAPLGIMALGVGVLMIAGEYDLSVGSIYTFTSIVAASFASTYFTGLGALGPFAALFCALAIGTLIGLINGFITLRFNIPSFITTLGTMLFWQGAVLLYNGATPVSFRTPEPFTSMFNGQVWYIHAGLIWFAILSVIFYFILHQHRLGNHFYAVGGNRNAAVAIGVKPVTVKYIAFALVGFTSAFAGIVAAARVSSVQPNGGQGLELQAIAACVIGGCALSGGRGSILGIVLGTLLIFLIKDVLLLLQAPGFYFNMFVGALIVISVILNTAVRRARA